MAEKAKASLHDEQTNQAAESIRALVVNHKLRGGLRQQDLDAFLSDMEKLAVSLEEQGKTPEQLEEIRKSRNPEGEEIDPNKTAAELVAETREKEYEAEKKKAEEEGRPLPPEPGKTPTPSIDPYAHRLGIPAVTSQPTTGQREAVEKTAKNADDATRNAGKEPVGASHGVAARKEHK
jgi:hypothetical protein